MALMVILTRAGLGLDAGALRRLSLVVVRLAFTPCLCETLTVGVAAHLLLGFPWIWGFLLGYGTDLEGGGGGGIVAEDMNRSGHCGG